MVFEEFASLYRETVVIMLLWVRVGDDKEGRVSSVYGEVKLVFAIGRGGEI